MVVNDRIILTIDGIEQNIEDILNIKFIDKIGSESDRITVKVKPHFPRPARNAKVELTFQTFRGTKLIEEMPCGLFHVQKTSRSNNNDLSFSATGVAFNDQQKQKLSNHYKDTKLSNIVSIVAKRLGHEVKFQTEDILIKSLLQTNETDINFLTRISKDYNVLFSIKNDFIYFVNKDHEELPVRTIDINKTKSPLISHSSKKFYKSSIASWHDIESGKIIEAKVGEGTPVLKFKGHFKTLEEAKLKAQAKLIDENKGIVTGSFSNRGIALYAGTKINITESYNGEDDGIYSVKECSHSWSKPGWTVNVQIEN